MAEICYCSFILFHFSYVLESKTHKTHLTFLQNTGKMCTGSIIAVHCSCFKIQNTFPSAVACRHTRDFFFLFFLVNRPSKAKGANGSGTVKLMSLPVCIFSFSCLGCHSSHSCAFLHIYDSAYKYKFLLNCK